MMSQQRYFKNIFQVSQFNHYPIWSKNIYSILFSGDNSFFENIILYFGDELQELAVMMYNIKNSTQAKYECEKIKIL